MNIYKVQVKVDNGAEKFTRILPVFANTPEEACKAVEKYYRGQYDTVGTAVNYREVKPSAGEIIWTDNWSCT